MKYLAEYQLGCWAPDDAACPYGRFALGRRCAWLAGFHDARRS